MRLYACFLVMLIAAPTSAETIDLYVISGQSNGFESRIEPADNVAPELTQIHPGIRYAFFDMFFNSVGNWSTLRPRTLFSPSPGTGIGVEMSFGLAMDAASDNPVAVIKAWRGGADLDEDFDPDATTGLLAYQSMMSYVNQRIGQLEAQGHTVNVKGFTWIQGESDAAEEPEQAERYGENLANFIASVRSDLAEPDLPFVYNRLNIGTDYIHEAAVRSGQEWVAQNVPGVVMLDVDDVQLLPDTHHYGVTSKIELGYRFASAMLAANNPLPGDLDGDGFVGIGDLNVVLNNWNQAVAPSMPGDPTGDGFVGIEDLNVVLSNWNAGAPPTDVLANVPEPGAGWLLLGAFAFVVFRRHLRPILVVFIVSLTLACATQTQASDSLINQGTRDWVAAATAGRADMLILGDSIVNHGLGWTGGIAHAASTRMGLAGTGMAASVPLQGESFTYPGLGGGSLHVSSDWVRPRANLPDNLEGLVLGSNVSLLGTAAASPRLWHAIGFFDNLLDRSAAYDWQLWVAATGATEGSIQGVRASRLQTPFTRTVLQTSPAVSVPMGQTAAQLVELSFAAAPGEVSDWHEFGLTNTTQDMAVFYNRLIDPNATGITVTGWGYPGGTTNDFVTDRYDNGHFDQAGRAAYLAALVHGNSGKLNVVIAMGVNDSGENEASLTRGITPGYSVEAFIDNIQTQIARVAADWAYADLPAADLSFTLPSTYQIGPTVIGEQRVARLMEYRDALLALAATDPRFSFIDMWGASPTAEVAGAENYIHDGIHPSRAGSVFYGSLFMNELLESVPISGDLDGDGFVGIEDLNIVLSNWNVTFEEPWVSIEGPKDYRADPNFDNFVGIEDLNIVLSNWNAGAPPTDVLANVPEPGVVGVVGLGVTR